ncbi:hypothetical protein NLX83_18065 [Allokutzneria sp. A3M-2-11 16]|uniref:hypothetical protein n=1 Tax=Allokutzneria sp. A3M-2-11 16 TaxID=2962043 RepID=UPI0020B777DC|nr:hypothetical protein [Allokutzneria sp. A3M-2-11 16]MCP3801169.1 hypothetical protein [Allokutzneria sp. A3M-2-11 16]
MPIRTNRGRTAVYRRLWGWPLRSPTHFVISLVIVVAAATGVGLLLPDPPPEQDLPQAQTSTSRPSNGGGSTPGSSSTAPRITTNPLAAPVPAAPAAEALTVAEAWTKAFVTHPDGITAQQWLAALRPHSTEEQMAVLGTVDPANVPATAVTGKPTAGNSTTSSVEVTVPTDKGAIKLYVIRVPEQGWRVSYYTPVE